MRFSRNHNLGIEEAKRRVDEVADELNARFDLHSAWQGNSLQVKGNHVSGHIDVADDTVDVKIHLGFTLAFFQGTIKSAVQEAMDAHFD